ncbi:MAG: GntR family transcriptional regulator [Lachnospiraceae bacterium]|nr:GntR family transcriptional regulator [Lachnospiraceae bacterium]
MNININSKSSLPIYEQIEKQIKEEIVSERLKEGEMLPSIRAFAAELKISVITIKRAYSDLEAEGLVYSVPGKGVYVDNPNINYLKEKETLGLEDRLDNWVKDAKNSGMKKEDAVAMLEILWD